MYVQKKKLTIHKSMDILFRYVWSMLPNNQSFWHLSSFFIGGTNDPYVINSRVVYQQTFQFCRSNLKPRYQWNKVHIPVQTSYYCCWKSMWENGPVCHQKVVSESDSEVNRCETSMAPRRQSHHVRGNILPLQTKLDITEISKQKYQWPHKKTTNALQTSKTNL